MAAVSVKRSNKMFAFTTKNATTPGDEENEVQENVLSSLNRNSKL